VIGCSVNEGLTKIGGVKNFAIEKVKNR
jgi:hypothetical protein